MSLEFGARINEGGQERAVASGAGSKVDSYAPYEALGASI